MHRSFFLFPVFLSLGGLKLGAAEPAAVDTLANDYAARLEEATEALVKTRESVLAEKLPLAESIREREDEVIDLRSQVIRLETESSGQENRLAEIEAEAALLRKHLDYAAMLAEESLSVLEASLQPGEGDAYGSVVERLRADLLAPMDDPAATTSVVEESRDLALGRLEQQMGGYRANGVALFPRSNRLHEGAFAHVGPLTYFRDADSGAAGIVRRREGSSLPLTVVLEEWPVADREGFFRGEVAAVPLDVSGGDALRLQQAKGSLRDHLRKGGYVGYVIILLGAFGLATGLLKLWDLRALAVNDPETVRRRLETVFSEGRPEPGAGVFEGLRKSVRELFDLGLRHLGKPPELLEELLYAHLLLQRNHHERRLPMLKVIATAAPLLGLLGTVVGMIKTFTLITVVGTGNATKLSSGISEALVTTELGLIVAIPTILIYGFLAHQTERRLALLEQYSTDFLNATR